MATTRRKTKSEETLEETEVRRPPVTQVVEVVEEQEEEPEIVSAQAESGSEDEGEEKRRVLVDELFQKEEKRDIDVAPEISMHTRSSSRSIMTWAIVSIVACLVVGGGLFLFSNKEKVTTMFASATPTPTSAPEPTPTPAVEVARDAVNVEVLNGGGVAGAAGKMKTLLEEKGYTVSDTGNADNYDYQTTEIYVKADKEDYLKLLEADLKETYSLGTVAATLEEDAVADVRVIVGKE